MAELLGRGRIPKEPVVGLTICYSYLWHREAIQGVRSEGLKDRPCVIVLNYEGIKGLPGRFVVDVVLVSHSPQDVDGAVEIPLSVKRRMGLGKDHSWIITTEIKRFVWPGPDLRPAPQPDPSGRINRNWGIMAHDIFRAAKEKVLARRAESTLLVVPRPSR